MFSIGREWGWKGWFASRLLKTAISMQNKTGVFLPDKISDICSAKGKTSLQQSATAKDMWDLDSQYHNCSKCYPGTYKFLPKDAQSLYGSAGEIGSLFSGSLSKQFRQIPVSKWQFYTFLSFGWAPTLVVILVRFLAACFLALQLTVHWGKQTTITTLWLLVMSILHPLQTKEVYTSLPQFE